VSVIGSVTTGLANSLQRAAQHSFTSGCVNELVLD
jgi:hypothetical protein